MAKYYGKVGFVLPEETAKGVWTEQPKEYSYFGDVTRNSKRLENGVGLNDDISISNTISIVADQFAYEHFFAIRYIKWMGTAWKVNSVEVQRPRLILTIGGVYNGDTA